MKRYVISRASPSTSYLWPACPPLLNCLNATYKDLKMGICCSCSCSCMHIDNTSVSAKIACLFITVSVTLYVISFNSNGWATSNERSNMTDISIGLWKACYTPLTGDRICVPTKELFLQGWNDEWLAGVQVLFSFGLVLEIFTAADMWAYIIIPYLQIGGTALYIAGCLSFAAAALCFLGVVIFGVQQASDTVNFQGTVLDWAYGTMVIALGCILLSYLLIMCDFYTVLKTIADNKNKKKKTRERLMNALDEAVISNQNSDDLGRSHQHLWHRSSLEDSDDNSVGSQAVLCKSDTDQGDDDDIKDRKCKLKGGKLLQAQQRNNKSASVASRDLNKRNSSNQRLQMGNGHNEDYIPGKTRTADELDTDDREMATLPNAICNSKPTVPVHLFEAK